MAGGLSFVMSWDANSGLRPLLRWPPEERKGAANIGTDGSVLVWSYGVGRGPSTDYRDYEHVYLMTAPFTTDPAVLRSTARTVVEEVDGWLGGAKEAYTVGCGYAVRVAQSHAQLVVVRLSDGATWVFPKLAAPLYWDYSVGATCEHIYALVEDPDIRSAHIVRIPIDSLGPPTR